MSSLRNPYNRQLDRIRRREDRLFRESRGGSALKTGLREKIESKIPEKLMETMDAAFYTAFQVIFKRGTGLLGKTIPEKRLRRRAVRWGWREWACPISPS